MKYRVLGATGLEVSEIGFGAWGIGGTANGAVSYGKTDDQESLRALGRAFELGITFYDTADLYGSGHSESLIGRAFEGVRSQVVIATKTGFVNAEGKQDFSEKHIRGSLESSLKRLRTDRVDLYQLHDPSIEVLRRGEAIAVMRDLKTEGKIRAFGVSLRSPDEGIPAVSEFGFGCIQVNFNLTDQRLLSNGLLELCRNSQAGIIARTPLSFGFLTGCYPEVDKLDPKDHRRNWSSEQVERWNRAPGLFLPALKLSASETAAQAALRFCLSYPIASAIPGMLTPQQVEENSLASEYGPLSTDQLGCARRIYADNEFFPTKR